MPCLRSALLTCGPACQRPDTRSGRGDRAGRRRSGYQRTTTPRKSSSPGRQPAGHRDGTGRWSGPPGRDARVGLTGRPGRWQAASTRLPSRGDPRARRPRLPDHVVRGLPAHGGPRPGRRRAADPRRRREPDLARVRRAGAPHRGRAARARRAPGPHRRPDDDQPPRDGAGRRGRDPPRRGAVLGLQHLHDGADRLPVRQRRQPGGGLRGGVPAAGAGGEHRPRPRRLRRRRRPRHHPARPGSRRARRTASTSRRPGGPSSPTTWRR